MKPTRVMQWRHGVSGCGLHKLLSLIQTGTSLHVMALAIALTDQVSTIKFTTHKMIDTHTDLAVLRRNHSNTNVT